MTQPRKKSAPTRTVFKVEKAERSGRVTAMTSGSTDGLETRALTGSLRVGESPANLRPLAGQW